MLLDDEYFDIDEINIEEYKDNKEIYELLKKLKQLGEEIDKDFPKNLEQFHQKNKHFFE